MMENQLVIGSIAKTPLAQQRLWKVFFYYQLLTQKKKRDVMSTDIPNAFVQTEMPEVKQGEDRIVMKITGVLVDMLVQLKRELYGPHVVFERGERVIYVQVMRAIYGMLQSALLWYKKFCRELEEHGFKFNNYDPCVAIKNIAGSQQTIRFSHGWPYVKS